MWRCPTIAVAVRVCCMWGTDCAWRSTSSACIIIVSWCFKSGTFEFYQVFVVMRPRRLIAHRIWPFRLGLLSDPKPLLKHGYSLRWFVLAGGMERGSTGGSTMREWSAGCAACIHQVVCNGRRQYWPHIHAVQIHAQCWLLVTYPCGSNDNATHCSTTLW